MLVITADQVDSRDGTDIAGSTRDELNLRFGARLPLPVDRNAGDEIQLIAPDGATALAIILDLTREGKWSVGVGAGEIRIPLPAATREANGTAFIAARAAIGRAKKRSLRFAVNEPEASSPAELPTATDAESLIELLLLLRSRRSEEGWELFDRMADGRSQSEVARELDVSAQAISSRAKIAGIRIELASHEPLARLLDGLDRKYPGMEQTA